MNPYTQYPSYFPQSAPTTGPSERFGQSPKRSNSSTHSEPTVYASNRLSNLTCPPHAYVPNNQPRSAPAYPTSNMFTHRYSASQPRNLPDWTLQLNNGSPFTQFGLVQPNEFGQATQPYGPEPLHASDFDMETMFSSFPGISTTSIPSHLSHPPLNQHMPQISMHHSEPVAIPLNQASSPSALPGQEMTAWTRSPVHDMMANYRVERSLSPLEHGEEMNHGPVVFSHEQAQGLTVDTFFPAHLTSPSYSGEDSAPTPALSTDEPNSELYMSHDSTPVHNDVAFPDDAIESLCHLSFPNDLGSQQILREIMVSINTPVGKAKVTRLLRVNNNESQRTWSCTFGGAVGLCGQSFKRRDQGVAHILGVHIRVYPVKCNGDCGEPNCNKRFPSPAAKSSHIRKGQTRICDLCGKPISNRNYSRHRKTGRCNRALAPTQSNGLG